MGKHTWKDESALGQVSVSASNVLGTPPKNVRSPKTRPSMTEGKANPNQSGKQQGKG